MAFEHAGRSYPSLSEFIAGVKPNPLMGPEGKPLYAYPIDGWILSALGSTPVKAALEKVVEAVLSLNFGTMLAQGITIDQKNFPEFYNTLLHCCRTLGIAVPHAVVQHDASLFNAFTAGTDSSAFICISSALGQYFTQQELCFVVGHECGHIAAEHMIYHTAVNILTGVLANQFGPLSALLRVTAGVPLMAWSRRSEITADRAGLLCCRNLAAAERALLKLVAGLAKIDDVEIDNYLRRSRAMNEVYSLARLRELFSSHPLIPKRIEALRLFADSELYHRLTGLPPPPGKSLLGDEVLNEKVAAII